MSPVLLILGGKWRWRKCHWKCHPPCHTSNAVASARSDCPFHSGRSTPPPINAGSAHCQIPRLFLFMSAVNTPDLSSGCKKWPPAVIRRIYYPETHLSLAQAEDFRVMTALSTGRWKKNKTKKTSRLFCTPNVDLWGSVVGWMTTLEKCLPARKEAIDKNDSKTK